MNPFDPMGFTLLLLAVSAGIGVIGALVALLIGDAWHRRKRAGAERKGGGEG